MPGKHLHWFGLLTFGTVNLAVGIADGIIAANKSYKTHYFDTSSGKKISQEEVNRRENIKKEEKKGRRKAENNKRGGKKVKVKIELVKKWGHKYDRFYNMCSRR